MRQLKIPLPLSAPLLLSVTAMAQSVTIGTTEFPLGENAFPNVAQCLDTTGCASGDNILVDNLDPLKRALSPANALLGHRMDLVALDLDATDAIRLLFAVPIVNQAGPDVYIGQVLFFGTMDGLGLGSERCSQDLLLVQVGIPGLRVAQGDRFVRIAHVQAVTIGVTEDGHSPCAQLVGRADDAHGDLSAVRDEDLLEGGNGHAERLFSERMGPIS